MIVDFFISVELIQFFSGKNGRNGWELVVEDGMACDFCNAQFWDWEFPSIPDDQAIQDCQEGTFKVSM